MQDHSGTVSHGLDGIDESQDPVVRHAGQLWREWLVAEGDGLDRSR